ncbi:hypothetical protein U1Q18_047037 [Sarracenia purpurea var. burkii]
MASNPKPFHAFLLIFNILLSIAATAFAGREIPINSKNADKKEPQLFVGADGSVLIPGIGRVILPKKGNHITFTGGPGGGARYGGIGGGRSSESGGGGSHNYVPGGDDTFLPNPGVEVPNPGSGGGRGGTPAEARP